MIRITLVVFKILLRPENRERENKIRGKINFYFCKTIFWLLQIKNSDIHDLEL